METAFLKVLNMSITASYIIAAVVLIRLLLKKAPKKYRYLLWSVVGFRLCSPVSFQSVFSLFSLKSFNMTTAQSSGGAALQYVPQNIGTMTQPSVTLGIPTANTFISSALPAATPAASVNPLQIWIAVGTVLWCTGIAALLIYSVVTYIRLHRQMANAVLLESNVYQSDKVCSPCVLGFFRPKIYIPFGLDEKTLCYVLAHEKFHIRRLDHVVKPFAFLLLTIHWFNPFCWLAFYLMGRDMEMSCDEKVLSWGEENIRKTYSTSLLSFASNRRFPAPSPLAFGETGVKSRIKNALSWKKPKMWITTIATVLCIVMLVACAANPSKTVQPADAFDKEYRVDAIVFDAPRYSFTYTADTAPAYRLTADHQLMKREHGETDWMPLGELQEITLTKENFDDYIGRADGEPDGWNDDMSCFAVRKSTLNAWRLDVPEDPNHVFYLVLQTKNGDVYLAYGYHDPEGETDPESAGSLIRWLFRLATPAETGKMIQWDKRPTLILDGTAYIDPYMPEDSLPDGYVYVGELSDEAANDTGLNGCKYYANPDVPDIVYVYQECGTPVSRDTVDTMRRQWAYVQWVAENVSTVDATVDPLDTAVSAAILEHNKKGYHSGDFACESHVVLATEGSGPAGGNQTDIVTVYAMVLYQEYGYSGGAFSQVGGSHIPTALTFHVSGDGKYTLTEYWIPRDGSYYAPDIKEKFPEAIYEEALDTQKYILGQIQACYTQAVEYGKVDTDAVVESLLEVIMSSPATSSNPGDYIKKHPIEYRELTYYGDYTLYYVFAEFLKGGQTELKGHIMQSVMRELLDGENISVIFDSPQDYFDQWKAHVLALRKKNDLSYFEQYAPKSYILLQMLDE